MNFHQWLASIREQVITFDWIPPRVDPNRKMEVIKGPNDEPVITYSGFDSSGYEYVQIVYNSPPDVFVVTSSGDYAPMKGFRIYTLRHKNDLPKEQETI